MDRINSTNNLRFTSKINPVKPYQLMTKSGRLNISELDIDKPFNHDEIFEIVKLFCDNISESIKTKAWQRYKNGDENYKKRFVYNYGKNLVKSMRDPEIKDTLTVLLAKDENGVLKGAAYSSACTNIPNAKSTTLYFHSISIKPEMRHQGLAQDFTNTMLDINRNTFTDAFATCTYMSKPMVEKCGFKALDPSNPNEKAIMDYLKRTRVDYPTDVTAMHMALQPEKPRWSESAAKGIQKWKRERPFVIMKKSIPYAIKYIKHYSKKLKNIFTADK